MQEPRRHYGLPSFARRSAVAVAAGLLGLALLIGCGSSKSGKSDTAAMPAGASDAAVKADLLRGVAQIRGTRGAKKLHGQLVRTLARLRGDRGGSTAAGRRGRRLAIRGFTWTLRGIQAQLDFDANDSGNVEAAIRDAKRSDRYLKRGANVLRAAGRAFGLDIGDLNGH